MNEEKAIVLAQEEGNEGTIIILTHVKNEAAENNSSSERNANNRERTETKKYFKEIANHLLNVTHLHVTGTGQAQEQFIHYLQDTPQFKNVETEDSTSNKMSDEKLIEFMATKF